MGAKPLQDRADHDLRVGNNVNTQAAIDPLKSLPGVGWELLQRDNPARVAQIVNQMASRRR